MSLLPLTFWVHDGLICTLDIYNSWRQFSWLCVLWSLSECEFIHACALLWMIRYFLTPGRVRSNRSLLKWKRLIKFVQLKPCWGILSLFLPLWNITLTHPRLYFYIRFSNLHTVSSMDLTGQNLSGNELNVLSVHRPLHRASAKRGNFGCFCNFKGVLCRRSFKEGVV